MKDINGKTIKHGDLMIFGMLSQMWLVTKKGKALIATIVSNDSGQGYEENLEEMPVHIKQNGAEIIGRVPGKLLRTN